MQHYFWLWFLCVVVQGDECLGSINLNSTGAVNAWSRSFSWNLSSLSLFQCACAELWEFILNLFCFTKTLPPYHLNNCTCCIFLWHDDTLRVSIAAWLIQVLFSLRGEERSAFCCSVGNIWSVICKYRDPTRVSFASVKNADALQSDTLNEKTWLKAAETRDVIDLLGRYSIVMSGVLDRL